MIDSKNLGHSEQTLGKKIYYHHVINMICISVIYRRNSRLLREYLEGSDKFDYCSELDFTQSDDEVK